MIPQSHALRHNRFHYKRVRFWSTYVCEGITQSKPIFDPFNRLRWNWLLIENLFLRKQTLFFSAPFHKWIKSRLRHVTSFFHSLKWIKKDLSVLSTVYFQLHLVNQSDLTRPILYLTWNDDLLVTFDCLSYLSGELVTQR